MPLRTLHSRCSLVLSSMASLSLAPGPKTRSVEDIFKDYSGRRAAVLRALTRDVDEFFLMCDPEKGSLCLYGLPNESWEVDFPVEEIPPEIPEPVMGINFARDEMAKRDWLALLAKHCDSWLMAVAFYFGARLNQSEREDLFDLINDQPTICEVLKEKKPVKRKCNANIGSKSKTNFKRNKQGKGTPRMQDSHDEDKDEQVCGICAANDKENEFRVCCALCQGWFHGKCVKLTPAKAKGMKKYKCSLCRSKRAKGNATKHESHGENKGEDEDKASRTICGICAENYNDNEFWLVCHLCEGRFHGKCVKIKPSKARRMKEYVCGFCSNEAVKGNATMQESHRVKKDEREKGNATMQESHGEDKDEDMDDSVGNTTCGICGANEKESEFWMHCDFCDGRFHGKCVKLTPAKAECIKNYKCPSCKNKTEKRNATVKESQGEENDKDKDDKSNTICGTCAENYNANEFWIVCDLCKGWFHGKCVKVTPAKAKRMKEFKCGFCSNGRGTTIARMQDS
nr:PHD finger protein ALFIN-LIKE 1-like [Ipomoea batatas]